MRPAVRIADHNLGFVRVGMVVASAVGKGQVEVLADMRVVVQDYHMSHRRFVVAAVVVAGIGPHYMGLASCRNYRGFDRS